MTSRRTWQVLSVGLVAATLTLYFLFPPFSDICPASTHYDPTRTYAITYGTVAVAYIVLAYYALAEPQVRWRVAGLAFNAVLMAPAFFLGLGLARFVLGPCAI